MFANIVIVAALIQTGLCMSCFSCNSKSQPKCNDPLDEAWVVFLECNQKDFKKLLDSSSIVFPKIKTAFQAYPDLDESKATCQKLVVKNGEENVVFRTCSMSDIQGMNTCEKHRQILGNDSVVFCEQCNSRLCNASDVTSISLMLLLISAFTTLIKTYL